MEEKLIGIVLNKTEYKENDVIINVFTLEKGVVSASLKGVKKAGAKLKFASQPFCFAEFLFSEKSGRRTVTGASLNDSFYPIRESVSGFYAACAALEFIKKFLKENIVSEELFFATVDCLKNIAYGDKKPLKALCVFLLTALKLSGYALNAGECFICGGEISGRVFFDGFSGGFICGKCFNGAGREINISTYDAIKNISLGREVSEEDAKFALRLLDHYITVKTDESIKSLKELIK